MSEGFKGSLAHAIDFATDAHRDQREPNGDPYILHVMRVVMRCEGDDRIVAALHDVLEDTNTQPSDLSRAGFSASVVEAVCALTKERYESYESYIEDVRTNAIATRVKLADIAENLNLVRLPDLTTHRTEKLHKYFAARDRLLSATPPAEDGR